jgi:hypothetical protein
VNLELGLRYELTTTARDQKLQDLNGISNITSIREERYTPELLEAIGGNPALAGQKIFDTLPDYWQNALISHVGERLLFQRPSPDIDNFGPRIGLAWDLFGDGRTSLRAGASIAHDVIYGNLALLQLPPQLQAENRETNACVLTPRPAWCSQVPAGENPQTVAAIRHSNIGFLEGGGLLPALPPDTLIDRTTARLATGNWVEPQEQVPESYTWSMSLQREMSSNWMVEGRYVGNHVINLPIQRWKSAGVPIPFNIPFFLTESSALATNFTGARSLSNFTALQDTILFPYGIGGVATYFSPTGHSWYHGASLNVEKRMSRGLQFNSSYTWSKTLDMIENDLFTSLLNPRRPPNSLDVSGNKGLSGMHREHKFVVSWVYEVPSYGSGAVNKLTSGWSMNGMYIAESGQPISIIANRDVNGDFDNAGDRVFFNPNGQEGIGSDVNFVCRGAGGAASIATTAGGCGGSANVVGYVARNPNAQYIRPGLGMATNHGRGTFIMPGINTWNLSFGKTTPFWGENRNLQFRVELWNAFNHPSYTLGTGSVIGKTSTATTLPGYATPGNPQFLDKKVLSGGLGNAPFQRIIQLGLKLNF